MARTVTVVAGTESVLVDDQTGAALTDDAGAELFAFDPTIHDQTVTVADPSATTVTVTGD